MYSITPSLPPLFAAEHQPSMLCGAGYPSAHLARCRMLSVARNGEALVGNALHQAVMQQNLDATKWLTQIGIDPNSVTSNGETALHLGVASGNVDIVSQLIAAGAYLNASDEEGDTPLHWAVREGCVAVAHRLLSAAAGGSALHINAANNDGDTPLHLSCSLGDAAMTSLLLEHGANPNLPNGERFFALDEALSNGHSALLVVLQNYHAQRNKQSYSMPNLKAFSNNAAAAARAAAAAAAAADSAAFTYATTAAAGNLFAAASGAVQSAATAAAAATAAVAGSGGEAAKPPGQYAFSVSLLKCSSEMERNQLASRLNQLSIAPAHSAVL